MTFYKLNRALKNTDIDFINESDVPFEIDDNELLGTTDSGWCDGASGQRIVTPSMRVVFDLSDPTHKTLVHTKYFGELELVS
jgi:hypothetical protein